VRRRLSYANVVSTLALFLALTGGAVYAASKIRTNDLAKNSVSAAKIKKNAVTSKKIRKGAVTFPKLRNGTLIVADASGGPIAATSDSTLNLPLNGTTSFTPVAGQSYTLQFEARAALAMATGPCDVSVAPLVNGNLVNFSPDAFANLSAPAGDPEFPNGEPVAGLSAPVGLTQPGAAQRISVKVFGDSDCTANSTVGAVRVVVERSR
jgi:hypothetical protein